MYLELFKNLKARILKSIMLSAMGNQTAQAKDVGLANIRNAFNPQTRTISPLPKIITNTRPQTSV